MTGLLKCYYGYRNRGDELLMMGVIDYLFDHYDLTHLEVEVGDRDWIIHRCELNQDRRHHHSHHVSFVHTRKLSMWTARYDMIFAGGGEVLAAQTRDFWRSGANYLLLFWRWIWSGRVVRLGGIETPSARYSKLLYRMMLPHAHQIVCRERTSYELALKYTDKVVLYHDWAIDVIEKEKEEVYRKIRKKFGQIRKDFIKSKNIEIKVGAMACLDRVINNELLNIKVPYFKTTNERLQVRDNKPTVIRQMVGMIVKHPTDDSYLMMQRSDTGNYTNPAGGVEQGDSMLDTVAKELLEETGYDSISIIVDLNHQVHYHQFAPHKDENRYGITNLFEVQLASLSQQDIDPNELAQHQAVWIPKDQVNNIINQPLVKYVWDYYCAIKEGGVFPTPMDWIEADNESTNALGIKGKKIPYFALSNLRTNIELQVRHNVACIIKHHTQDLYLYIQESDHGDVMMVAGGIEDDEDMTQAGIREITEETGYTDIRFDRIIIDQVHFTACHASKNINRYGITSVVSYVLGSDQKIDSIESDITPVRLTPEQLDNKLKNINLYARQVYQGLLPNPEQQVDENHHEIVTKELIIKKKVLILHGKKRSNVNHSTGWIEQTKNELQSRGYEVKTPIVEHSWEIGWQGWEKILDQHTNFIDGNTILIGHSAGAAAIVRWLGENHITIKKLILVAPGYISRPFEANRIFSQTGELVTNDGDAGMRDLYDFIIDPTINDLVLDDIIIYTSNDEDRLLQSAQKYLDKLHAKHIILEDRGHFNNSYGPQNSAFLELVEEIIGDYTNTYKEHVTTLEFDQGISEDRQSQIPTNPYIIINFIPKHTNAELIQEFDNRILDYPDHQIINFPAEKGDILPAEITEQYYDRITTRHWSEHEVSQTLGLFAGASAAFVHRLHCVIPALYYDIPMHTAAYSEKVNKIIAMMSLKQSRTPV